MQPFSRLMPSGLRLLHVESVPYNGFCCLDGRTCNTPAWLHGYLGRATSCELKQCQVLRPSYMLCQVSSARSCSAWSARGSHMSVLAAPAKGA